MRRATAAAIAALAVVGLVVSLTTVWSRLGPGSAIREPEPGPAASTSLGPSRTGTAEVGRSDAALGAAEPSDDTQPVRVTMRTIGIAARVRPVGVAADGQVELPPDPRVLGWYRFGPAPASGDGGSVVLAGHLDSDRFGLGPLVRLRDLQAGALVRVTLSDGGTRTYTVLAVDRFDRQALPDELFSRSGPERLRIITCGGEYDAEAGGYQKNLVVTAAPA